MTPILRAAPDAGGGVWAMAPVKALHVSTMARKVLFMVAVLFLSALRPCEKPRAS
jgi:hypothetical protein